MIPDRAQSESIGVILFTGIITISIVTLGGFVLSDFASRGDRPLANFEVGLSEERVTVTHALGDSFDAADLVVDVRNDSVTHRFHVENGALTGDDLRFDPGERWHNDSRTYSGRYTVRVIHEPSNAVLFEGRKQVDAGVTTPITATDDSYSTDEDTPLSVSPLGVLGNDNEPDGDSLTASVTSGPEHGSLALDDDGSFTYEPDADYNGRDDFTYRASDGDGNSDTATVTITINAVNDAPTADAGPNRSVNEGGSIRLDGSGSDDVDSDDALSYSWEIASGRGSLDDESSQTPTYVAPSDIGADETARIELSVTDGDGATDTDTVTVTVDAVNEAPSIDSVTLDDSTSSAFIFIFPEYRTEYIAVSDDDGNLDEVKLELVHNRTGTVEDSETVRASGSSWEDGEGDTYGPVLEGEGKLAWDSGYVIEITVTDTEGETDVVTITDDADGIGP